MYTQEQFLEDVKKEATALRNRASPQELENISHIILEPKNRRNCIYGQMTGDCFSQRAATLIFECTPRYFDHGIFKPIGADVDYILAHEVGESIDNFTNIRTEEGYSSEAIRFSAIEAYLVWEYSKPYILIAYLRSETGILDF